MTEDLNEQREALIAAHAEAQSRSRFIGAVLGGVSAGVMGVDSTGRISACNAQALVLLGVADRQVEGLTLAEAALELMDVAEEARGGHDAEAEVDVVRGGILRRLRVRASMQDEGGLVLTFDDITRLVAAQRNAAWKDVARRIAHEIKNPLTPIQLSAERLRRKYRKFITSDVETFDRCTETIERQVGDIGRMVDEFSSFARMPTPKFTVCDAHELLRRTVFARRVADPDIFIEITELDGECRLICDERMVGQALSNLLKNAAESIAARRLAKPEPAGRIDARLILDKGRVVFEVEDNGLGLPEKDRDRLTEPYVTTHERGTGLGLAIVRRIMEEHSGALNLEDSRSGAGARVILDFPQGDLIGGAAPAAMQA